MTSYLVVYIAELVVYSLVWIIGSILFITKHRRGLFLFLTLSIATFIVAIALTFVLEKPVMKLQEIENIEAKTEVQLKVPKTTYHFRDITNRVKVIHNVDLNVIGEYEVQFEVDTLLGKYVKKDIVKVVDTTPPEITLNGDEEFKQSYSSEYSEPGYSAVDKYDGDLTQNVEVVKEEINEEEYNLKYSVKDSSGNKAEKIRHVKVIDDTPPKILLKGNSQIYLTINETYQEKGATAQDDKDGDVSDKIEVEGTVDSSKEGEYAIYYKVKDSNGNEAMAKRIVTVATETKVVAQDGSGSGNGIVYLTFDDGPTTSSTPKILDILKKKGVKATFFVINYDSEGEKLVKREYEEGHTVAIHGYSHKYEEIYQSVDAYMNNITKLQDKIKESTGYTSTITRFPGGSSNTVSKKYCPGIMTTLCKEIVSKGYTYFDWNVDSNDAGNAKSADNVYNNVTKGLKKTRSNVVLMHDFGGNNKTIDALERIIDYGINNGYTFQAITKDTPMVTHTPNN